jgi:hypothetical protein
VPTPAPVGARGGPPRGGRGWTALPDPDDGAAAGRLPAGFPRVTRRRWPVVAASLAAVLGTVAVAALTAAHDRAGSQTTHLPAAIAPGPSTGQVTAKAVATTAARKPTTRPLSSALAATDVTIRDDVRSVTVSWRDPSGGRAVARLEVVRDGQSLFLGDMPVGVDHYRLDGLSPDRNLCATVTLVYDGVPASATEPVCTHR